MISSQNHNEFDIEQNLRSSEWCCVGLRTFLHRRICSGIKEHIRVVSRILSLNESVQFRVLGCSLAKNGVAVRRRVSSKILPQNMNELSNNEK